MCYEGISITNVSKRKENSSIILLLLRLQNKSQWFYFRKNLICIDVKSVFLTQFKLIWKLAFLEKKSQNRPFIPTSINLTNVLMYVCRVRQYISVKNIVRQLIEILKEQLIREKNLTGNLRKPPAFLILISNELR